MFFFCFHYSWRKNHHQQLGETNTGLYVNVSCSYDRGGDLIPLSPSSLPPLTSENKYTICQTYAVSDCDILLESITSSNLLF